MLKSHVGNGEDDFDGLEELNLDKDVLEKLKQARITARWAIDKLEPYHISSWADLIRKAVKKLHVRKAKAGK